MADFSSIITYGLIGGVFIEALESILHLCGKINIMTRQRIYILSRVGRMATETRERRRRVPWELIIAIILLVLALGLIVFAILPPTPPPYTV